MMYKKPALLFIILVVIIGIFLFDREQIIKIDIVSGEHVVTVDGKYIYEYEEISVFPAVVRSSGQKPVETEYKGIELINILENLDINVNDIEKATFIAEDGYRIVLSRDELYEPSNVYIVFERDGEPLRSKKQGGNGPFQLIIRRDPFSQRWIKHVKEIILE